jgi:predicted AAA+ superfamily ATPase
MSKINFTSILELRKSQTQNQIYTHLADMLRYGLAPEVLAAPTQELKKEALLRLANHCFLEKVYSQVSLPFASFAALLKLLAGLVGEETSLEILAEQANLGAEKIGTCLDALEAAGLVYRLLGYPPDLHEASRGKFILYFSDNGLCNVALAEFGESQAHLEGRRPWANFVLSERMKKRAAHPMQSLPFYWHTREGFRLDYLEASGDEISGTNFGFEVDMLSSIQAFNQRYPGAFFMTVTLKNMWGFVT